MRFSAIVLLLFLLIPSTAIADKLIMVCEDVTGKRVDFNRSSGTFDEDKDGYSNAKHIFIFDEENPDKVSVGWQSTTFGKEEFSPEFFEKFVKGKFNDEQVALADGHRFITVQTFGGIKEVFTTIYNFDEMVVLSTRTRMGVEGQDMVAFYKGRCERLN